LAVAYLIHYQAKLEEHRAETALRLSNFKRDVVTLKESEAWATISKEKEPLYGVNDASEYLVYRKIEGDYITPRQATRGSGNERHYSMLLYGPPGTGKTVLAEDIATSLKQELITITPSDFTVTGEVGVEARAKDIFDVLLSQADRIVLFDEIDRLLLDRDSQLYLQQGDVFQFLTPGMLTKLRDLRRAERCMFIIATNLAERIDPAVKRRGRIDDQYLLLPPNQEQRKQILLRLLGKRAERLELSGNMFEGIRWEGVLKVTTLMVYEELKTVAERIKLAADPPDSGPLCPSAIAEQLQKEATKVGPSLTLTSYEARFGWDLERRKALLTIQEPYAEFFLLVYLIAESGRGFRDDEKEVLRRCANWLRWRGEPGVRRERNLDEEVANVVVAPVIAGPVAGALRDA
jgi:SpoVK/Ycf46/Vps4 family AAA+-type ATPase